MLKFLLAAVLAISTATFAHADAYEIPNSRFSAGGWAGHAFADNQTGTFTGCMISNNYVTGHSLIFSATANDRFIMFVHHPAWRLPVGATYPNQMMIDGVPFSQGTARAISPRQVVIELAVNERTFQGFRYGNVLTLQSINLRLRLTGTAVALQAMANCWNSYMNDGAPANPYSARSY